MAKDDKLIDTETGHKGGDIWLALGYLGTFLFGVLGGLLGAVVGYFMGREHNTVYGAAIGFTLCATIGLFAFGVFKYYWRQLKANSPLMEKERFNHTGFLDFDLFVTVHRCQNVMNAEGLAGFFGSKNDSFIKVEVGRIIDDQFMVSETNPVKMTCVNKSNVFEECFRLRIARTDEVLKVALYDQDLVNEDLVGWTHIKIVSDILEAHFPQEKGFPLKSDDTSMFKREVHAGTVILSFTPGGNFPKDILKKGAATERHLEAYRLDQKRQEQHQALVETKKKAKSYGTWAVDV